MNQYGLFSKLQAQQGKGLELGEILLEAATLMQSAPGCVLYVVNRETTDPDAIWVMEVWERQADHDNSLQLPGVRELIGRAMPILVAPPEGGLRLEALGRVGIS